MAQAKTRVRKPRQVDLAWAAGLFEGEGCVRLDDGRTRLELETTDQDVALDFASIMRSGTVRQRNKNWRHPHHKTSWRWQAGAIEDVTRICGWLYPFLGERRRAKMTHCLANDRRLA